MKLDEIHASVIQKFMEELDYVPSSVEAYVAALEHLYSEVESRLEAARDDLRRKNKGRK